MTIPESIKKEITGWFQVVFDWETISKGLFRSDKTIYHAADSDAIPMRFWMNTQYVIRKVFGYRASFITMIYKEFHHDCILHVESSIIQGRKSNVEVIPLGGENSPTKTILIKIGVARHVVFDDSRIYELKRGRMSSEMCLVDLVSAGYDNAELHDDDLPKEVSTTIVDLSRMLEEGLNCSFGSIKTIYKTMHDIALMIVSYAYPSMTFRSKNFSLFNQKCYGSDALNYSSSGAFVLWKRPVIERLDQNLEYQLWLKDIRLDSYDKTISDMRRIAKVQATHTAVGSIMSRNGSHNIGSHVLAALSHNVGTMPDDRVLYQYIQHRMDYIATVTTDFPTWTQPTMLLGGLMKTFLSQRHLLDHITESEGLSAWRFQGRDLTKDEREGLHWIQFHVRQKMKSGEYCECIHYENEMDAKHAHVRVMHNKSNVEEKCNNRVDLGRDVSLAIPGGAVGQHAFYTILENILRNAAKHDWSTMKTGRPHDLPFYVDFFDDEDSDSIAFEIWTRLRPLSGGRVPLNDSLVDDWLRKFESPVGLTKQDQKKFDALPVHQRQQVLIERPFIDVNGCLRRENWGLAEMKISAGYLGRRDVGEIGGLERSQCQSKHVIIRPGLHKEANKYYLSYSFSIPKSRELLLIVDKLDDGQQQRLKVARRIGVFVKGWEDLVKERGKRGAELNYRFVVHPNVSRDVLVESGVKFPFRVISGKQVEESSLRGMVPVLEDYADCIEKLTTCKDVEIIETATEVRKKVYECWCRLQIEERLGRSKWLGLLLAPADDGSGDGVVNKRGHSLISDADVLQYVLRECFATCVSQFTGDDSFFRCKDDGLKQVLKGLTQCSHTMLETVDLKRNRVQDEVARQLCLWLGNLGTDCECGKQALSMKRYLTGKLPENCGGYVASASADVGFDLEDSSDPVEVVANRIVQGAQRQPIDDFIDYVATVHSQMKVLFKQYEESIVSLPDGFTCANMTAPTLAGVDAGKTEVPKECCLPVKIAHNPADAQNGNNLDWIAYRRHDNVLAVDNGKRTALYVEPLSGTQSYLTQLMQLARSEAGTIDELGLYARLVENGLMRMLVLDERVAKFVREHRVEVEENYRAMCISVGDDTMAVLANEAISKKSSGQGGKGKRVGKGVSFDGSVRKKLFKFVGNVNSEMPKGLLQFRKEYEILIVHQGLLDKWFEAFKNDRTKMSRLLDAFKRMFKYVVITTGRGTPTNIPTGAHLVPFAVVESALFRKYPEKLILVDTVLNVLAVRNTQEGDT